MDRRVGQRWMREDQGGTRSLVDCPWLGRPSGTVLLPSVALSVLTHALCIPGAVSDKREERDHGEGSKVEIVEGETSSSQKVGTVEKIRRWVVPLVQRGTARPSKPLDLGNGRRLVLQGSHVVLGHHLALASKLALLLLERLGAGV
jgi:hypothetical protein